MRFEELQSRAELTAGEEHEHMLLNTLCDLGERSRRAEVAQQMLDRRFRVALNVNAALNADVKAFMEDELTARCATLDIPVLLVAGYEDPRPPFAIDSLAQALPRAELVVMPGTGHLPWLEDPDRLRAVLRQFVTRVTQASTTPPRLRGAP